MASPPLPRDFYDRHVVHVARDLLGKLLVRTSRQGRAVGRIVEVEAYLAEGDSACHAARGPTARNRVMFGEPGTAYVYAIHTRHCLNAVTDAQGVPSAVLIRAVEPLTGLAAMRRRRRCDRPLDLARGPGRLCEAFDIDRQLNQTDLTQRRGMWISEDSAREQFKITESPRIGVTSAADLQLRFFVNGSRYVSGPRKWHAPDLQP